MSVVLEVSFSKNVIKNLFSLLQTNHRSGTSVNSGIPKDIP